MTPAQLAAFADARSQVAALHEASAEEERATWGRVFECDPKESRGMPLPELVKEVAAELQERCVRLAHD